MSTTPIATPSPTKKQSIIEKGMFLSITRGWPPLSKAVPKEKVKIVNVTFSTSGEEQENIAQNQPERKAVSTSKSLLQSKELRKLYSLDIQIDDYIERKCLPFPGMQRGVRLIPNDLLDEVDKELLAHIEKRKELIDDVVKIYDQMKEEAKSFLGDLYNPADYLPVDEFRSRFKFSYNYLDFTVAQKIIELNKDIALREQQKMASNIEDATQSIVLYMRKQTQELVAHLADKLGTKPDGSKKIFRDSSVENLKEFISTFKALNIAEDVELEKLIEQMRKMTEGISPDKLRTDDALRSSIQNSFEKMKKQLDLLITTAPERQIDLSEE